jgi:DNA polymerase-4
MRTQPSLLHVDLDAFYASVEQLHDPSLRGKPVVVGGIGGRGVVCAASYEARAFGVHSAMPTAHARRLCPHAAFLPPRFDAYGEASRAVHAVFNEFTPLVEPIALDEAFLDVAGALQLFGAPRDIAIGVRKRIKAVTGLTASVGAATVKLLAKLASDSAKPDGLLIIEPGAELAFLHPLPVQRLWGVGPATLRHLERFGVVTVADLAQVPVETLVDALGSAAGRHLHELAWARDDRAVETDREVKSVGQEETFAHDVTERDALHREALRLADRVGSRLRDHDLTGRTITVKVRYSDFTTITRSATVPEPTAATAVISSVALDLLTNVDLRGGVRLLGVTMKNFVSGPQHQPSLFDVGVAPDVDPERGAKVDDAIDAIRKRYGDDAVRRAALLPSHEERLVPRDDRARER